jgi:flagellar basal-body rod protein FlgB
VSAFPGVDAMEVLRQAMKVAEQNHRIIANNIANADTPGYNAVQLDFQKTLNSAVEAQRRASLRNPQAHGLDASFVNPQFKPLASLSKNDYNKVDMDAELARLSENSGNFTVFSSLLAKRFSLIKNTLSTIR